jgi:hypothetical protein
MRIRVSTHAGAEIEVGPFPIPPGPKNPWDEDDDERANYGKPIDVRGVEPGFHTKPLPNEYGRDIKLRGPPKSDKPYQFPNEYGKEIDTYKKRGNKHGKEDKRCDG